MDATLLLCDHQSASRDALKRFFSRCGFRVETACDGWECLNIVRSLQPDVLVIDSGAPRGGAAAVLAFLHESCFEFEMPFVLVVGNAPPATLSQRTGVPESSCFQKPLPSERLLDRVGLAIALIDLRDSRQRRFPAAPLGRPRQAEPCLV